MQKPLLLHRYFEHFRYLLKEPHHYPPKIAPFLLLSNMPSTSIHDHPCLSYLIRFQAMTRYESACGGHRPQNQSPTWPWPFLRQVLLDLRHPWTSPLPHQWKVAQVTRNAADLHGMGTGTFSVKFLGWFSSRVSTYYPETSIQNCCQSFAPLIFDWGGTES